MFGFGKLAEVAQMIPQHVVKECFGMLDTTDQRQEKELDELRERVAVLEDRLAPSVRPVKKAKKPRSKKNG